jgi:predicted metalloendopeptidase
MAAYMGQTIGALGGSFFATGISTDQKQPDRYVVSAGQSGLGMPNRDFYLSPLYADKKELYLAYIARMLEMIGWEDPAGNAQRILDLETQIAQAHWTPAENRNRDRTYNEYTIQQLVSDAPGFDWTGYFGAARLGDIPRLIVRQNTAMPQIAAIYAEAPIETLRACRPASLMPSGPSVYATCRASRNSAPATNARSASPRARSARRWAASTWRSTFPPSPRPRWKNWSPICAAPWRCGSRPTTG